jgi:hypothetical protein
LLSTFERKTAIYKPKSAGNYPFFSQFLFISGGNWAYLTGAAAAGAKLLLPNNLTPDKLTSLHFIKTNKLQLLN